MVDSTQEQIPGVGTSSKVNRIRLVTGPCGGTNPVQNTILMVNSHQENLVNAMVCVMAVSEQDKCNKTRGETNSCGGITPFIIHSAYGGISPK